MKESGEGDGKITFEVISFEVIFFVTLRIFMQLFFCKFVQIKFSN